MFINCFQRLFGVFWGVVGYFFLFGLFFCLGVFLFCFFLPAKIFSCQGGKNSAKGAGLTGKTNGIFFLGLVNLISLCFQWL